MLETLEKNLRRRHTRNLFFVTLILIALFAIISVILNGNLSLILLIFVSLFWGIFEGLKYLGILFYLLVLLALLLVGIGIFWTKKWALFSYFFGLLLLFFCGMTGIGQHY